MLARTLSVAVAFAFVFMVGLLPARGQADEADQAIQARRDAIYRRHLPGYAERLDAQRQQAQPNGENDEQRQREAQRREQMREMMLRARIAGLSATPDALLTRPTTRATKLFDAAPAAGPQAGGPIGHSAAPPVLPWHYNFYRQFPWYPYGNYNFNYNFSRPNVRFRIDSPVSHGSYGGYGRYGSYGGATNVQTRGIAISASYLYGRHLGLGALRRVVVRQHVPTKWVYSGGRYRYVPGGTVYHKFFAFQRSPHFPHLIAGF